MSSKALIFLSIITCYKQEDIMQDNYTIRINKAKELFKNTGHIVVGAGAGLSTAAGLEFTGSRFTENFASFICKYHMEDLYTSSFYPFQTEEEKWAYWAKHISLNRYETPATPLYKQLLHSLEGKDYFVITTNVDGQFRKAGFDTDQLFEVQGDYALFQCRYGCHSKLYDNEEAVKYMLTQTIDCRIPSYLIPKCPICGCEMDINLRKDEYFVQDNNWYDSSARYNKFLSKVKNKPVVFLEIGVGFNTPVIIKYPFEEMVYKNQQATLIRMNKDFPVAIRRNEESTISFDEDIQKTITLFTDIYPENEV